MQRRFQSTFNSYQDSPFGHPFIIIHSTNFARLQYSVAPPPNVTQKSTKIAIVMKVVGLVERIPWEWHCAILVLFCSQIF